MLPTPPETQIRSQNTGKITPFEPNFPFRSFIRPNNRPKRRWRPRLERLQCAPIRDIATRDFTPQERTFFAAIPTEEKKDGSHEV